MSWAEEDWTVGLSGRVQQKVKELQVLQERLSRENKQKQLQLDNINTSLEKQAVKYDEVRGELQSVQRELQSVREETKAAVVGRERLSQELQTKHAQVCSLEGQLDGARTANNKLTQEVKRLEAEIEKLQNSGRAETTLFSTPCWSASSPWEQNGFNNEGERQGHRDEAQGRAPIRQRLQFSTPHRQPSDQLESFSTPLSVFPWERDDTRQAARRQSQLSPQAPCTDVISQGQSAQGLCGKEKLHRTETDKSLSEMQSRVTRLEEELSVKSRTMKAIQSDLVQSRKELGARDHSLHKAQDELSLAQARISKESERASEAEQRQKHLQEELKCQRQNTESSRLQHQQRTKELEKQHQRDLTELQKERQCLEKQHQQEVNKLNQELQQARTLHNALQAQADKLTQQKQALDKELDMLKEKLKWTEGQLQESQKREAQTQAKLTEALREAEGVAVCLEQSRKKERALEEEGRRLAEERADALHLLKDLQEQKAVPAPQLQPAQYCPVVQSFSAQPPPAVHSRSSAHTKRPQKKEDGDAYERCSAITASYPFDREPGEGIDSEHMAVLTSTSSEGFERESLRGKGIEGGESTGRKDVTECEGPGPRDHTLSSVSCPTADMSTNASVDVYRPPSAAQEQAAASEALRRENAMLRSEMKEVREELQKRLEDLEAQRRAEAEARTRLKQLSRKHASQSVEREEQEKEWRTKLESEKRETEKLRKAVVAFESETSSTGEQKGRGRAVEEDHAPGDRDGEMVELNIQLKKQLAEVKAQLAIEHEDRKRDVEERNLLSERDAVAINELNKKLSALEAELEEIKHSGKEVEEEVKVGKENPVVSNSPLTYLTLRDDELNSNVAHRDDNPLLSPEQHLLFCQSTNRLNALASREPFGEAQTAIDSDFQCSPGSAPGRTRRPDSQAQITAPDYLEGTSAPPGRDDTHPQKGQIAHADLANEVECLQKENAKETERANQSQVKLEALQTQVTRQTRQLTMAFEMQSQHISDLLAELQEKENALLSQGEELQRCKRELDASKSKNEDKEVVDQYGREEGQHETLVETAAPDRDDYLTKTEAATPTHVSSGEINGELDQGSDSDKTGSISVPGCVKEEVASSQDGGTTHLVAELQALRKENRLLKRRIEEASIASDIGGGTLATDGENQAAPVRQSHNTGNADLACWTAQRPSSVQNVIDAEGPESLLQNERRIEGEGGHLAAEDARTTRAEEELEEVSDVQIKHLGQQVVALQMKIHALSAETQQQTEELTMWRLASQPAPTFDRVPPTRDYRDEKSAVDQSNRQEGDEANLVPAATKSQAQVQAPASGIRENPSNVTFIREDELLLSCSSNKLLGRMLFSRLQHKNLPEPKSSHHSKKTAALQEHIQDTSTIDKESEKENQEGHIIQRTDTCSTHHKEERDSDAARLSPEQTDKHSSITNGPTKTKSECHKESPVFKANSPRASGDIFTANYSPEKPLRKELKSVSSQTEESPRALVAPTASELRCVHTQTEAEEHCGDLVASPPVPPIPLSKGPGSGDKMLFSGSFPIPSDPARLAERIRRNRTQLSAAFDDTEYEPYGLPEVVMKGFADIPSGPSCPYIVRRGLLGTSALPVPQKDLGPAETETD